MPSEKRPSSDGSRSDWRGGAARDAGARNVRTEGVRWKRLPKSQSPGISNSTIVTWLKRVMSALAATGFVAAMIWLLLLPGCHDTKIAPLVVDQLIDPAFAPPGQAQQAQDVEQLRDSLPRVDVNPEIPNPSKFNWSDWLREKHDRNSTAYVIYLSATSIWRNEDHAPERCFLLEESSPDQQDFWLPAKGLWTALADELPPNTLKLVFLDTARAAPSWRGNGFGSEDFSDLQEAANDIPNLAVMTSCAPGERSWGSHDLGSTAFLQAITQALAGSADQGRSPDRRLHLHEVLEYVATRTNHWTKENRTPWGQSPQQFVNPALQNAPLEQTLILTLRRTPKEPLPASHGSELESFEDTFRPPWSTYEANTQEFWRLQPLKWSNFCFDIGHAERLWLAGNAQAAQEWIVSEQLNVPLKAPAMLPELAWTKFSPASQLEKLLNRFGDEPFGWKIKETTIQSAVRLRRESELAARQIGERTQRFSQQINQLDRDRRTWEDQAYFHEAPKTNAEIQTDRWRKIQEHAQTLADARDMYEKLLARLPNAAEWASESVPLSNDERRIRGDGVKGTAERMQLNIDAAFSLPAPGEWKSVEGVSPAVAAQWTLMDLFESSRQLAQELRVWETDSTFGDSDLNSSPARLKSLADASRTLLESFEETMTQAVQQAVDNESQPVQWNDWQQVANLLAFRGMPPDSRVRLWSKLFKYDQELNDGTGPAKTADPVAKAEGSQQVHMSREASLDASWRSLWTLQHLSLGVPRTDGRIGRLRREWSDCTLEKDPQKQHAIHTQLCVGAKQLSVELSTQVTDLAHSASQKTFEDVRKSLWDIDRAVRVLPGYDARRHSSDDHSSAWRRWMRIEYSLWQAKRYLDDFYAGDGLDDHWFDQAATACLKSVDEELKAWKPSTDLRKLVDQELQRVKDLLAKRRGAVLVVTVPDTNRFKFGTESELPLSCTMRPQGDVPTGSAVVGLISEHGDQVSVDKNGYLRSTAPDGNPLAALEFQLTRKNASESACGSVSLKPRTWFRGHRGESAAFIVDPCQPIPWTIVEVEPPSTGTLVLQGRDRKSLMFVLDCSESMNGGSPTIDPDLEKFFYPAIDTLTKTIQNLDNRMPPYRVGLVAYAHRYRLRNNTRKEDEEKELINGKIPKSYLDVNLNKRLSTAYQEDFQTLFPIKELQSGKGSGPQPINQLLEQLKSLRKAEPWGNTPLLGAIIRAIDELSAKKESSGSLVVAITDGGAQDDGSANSFLDRTASLRQRLRDNPKIKLCVVGYNLDEKSKMKLQDLTSGLSNSIQFLDAPTSKELAAQLEKAISERPYQITGVETRTSKLGEPLSGLRPGDYAITFPGFKQAKATIAGGEKLVFDLDHEASGEERIRHIPHPDHGSSLAEVRAWDDSVAGHPNRLVKYSAKRSEEGTEIVVAMDRIDRKSASSGFVQRPNYVRFLLIRAGAEGKDRFLPFTVELAAEQSVPAWRLVVPKNVVPPVSVMPELVMGIRSEQPTSEIKTIQLGDPHVVKPELFLGPMVSLKWYEERTASGVSLSVEIRGMGVTTEPDKLLDALPWMELGRKIGGSEGEFVPLKPIRRMQRVYFEDDKVVSTWEFDQIKPEDRTHLRFGKPQLRMVVVNGKITDDAQND